MPTSRIRAIPYNEISEENFSSLYTTVLEKLKDATYIALDTEFTGHCRRVTKNMEQRYAALADVVRSHAILSFGLTTITARKQESSSECTPFIVDNFEFLVSNQDSYRVDPSNLKFLAENGLDFNRHFALGIPYYSGVLRDNGDQCKMREFWLVLLRIVQTRRIPIIIHNGLLDLMYIYQSFIADLPTNHQAFVQDLVQLFPGGVYDTKFLANFVLYEQTSFLAYLYCKYDRMHSDVTSTKLSQRIKMHVQDPLPIPPSHEVGGKKRALEQEGENKPAKRRRHHQKHKHSKPTHGLCTEYARHGWCKAAKQCTLSHDLDRILDRDQGIKTVAEVEEDVTQEASPTATETTQDEQLAKSSTETAGTEGKVNEEDIDGKRRDHAAHFDAYMTGFVFCHMLVSLGAKAIEEHINKVNLMRLDIPLRLVKSAYAKPTAAIQKVMERIQHMASQMEKESC